LYLVLKLFLGRCGDELNAHGYLEKRAIMLSEIKSVGIFFFGFAIEEKIG